MLYVFHGSDLVSSRQAWLELKVQYQPENIFEFSKKDFDLVPFQNALEGQSLFADRKLVTLEGLPDLRKFKRLPELFVDLLPGVSVAIWVPKDLPASHKLIKLAKTKGRSFSYKVKESQKIFSFLDYLFSKKAKETFRVLEELKEEGESPVYLLAMIISQARSLLAVVVGSPYIEKKHPFYLRNLKARAGNFTQPFLENLLDKLFSCDYQAKTGRINSDIAILVVVSYILSG